MTSTVASQPSTNPAGVSTSAPLKAKLTALGRRQVGVTLLTGVALVLVVAIELLALALFLDWWLEMPWTMRCLSLLVQIAVFGFLLATLVYRPWRRQPSEDELALMVEKARPEFRSRLIAAVQLPRPGAVPPTASMALANALVSETEQLSAPLDFREIVATDRLKRFGMMALMIPLLAALGFAANPGVSRGLLRRACLSTEPVPRKTRVIVPQGERVVGIGDSLWLEGFAEGILPANGRVSVEYRHRRPQEFPLLQDRDNRAHFGRLIENVQESFSYRLQLGDGVSPTFQIKAFPRPSAAKLECEQIPPAYTGLKAIARSPGDLTLLIGSTLRIRASATKDLVTASIRQAGVDSVIPLVVDAQHPRELQGEFLIASKSLTGFQIQMRDTDAMDSRGNAIYRVDVLPDKTPAVRLTYPERREQLATRRATVLLAFEASDDFGLSRVRLKYKVEALEPGVEKTIELDLEENQPLRLKRRYEWILADYLPQISEGHVIEYWIEAEDNNNVTGPGLGSSEHQLAKIVSEADKRADLLNRAADSLSGIGDVASDQEKLNQTLGTMIRQKAGLR